MRKIEKEKFYSLSQVLTMNVFSWIKSRKTLVKFVLENRKVLLPFIKGTKTSIRYLLKGERLIRAKENIDKYGVIKVEDNK